jgi:hypothetical protein
MGRFASGKFRSRDRFFFEKKKEKIKLPTASSFVKAAEKYRTSDVLGRDCIPFHGRGMAGCWRWLSSCKDKLPAVCAKILPPYVAFCPKKPPDDDDEDEEDLESVRYDVN